MTLDDRGVHALGKVSDERKLTELARADVLCAPSLGGESFGMILTEAFAASTPVLASDIPGYRDVVRDGIDGQLVASGDPLALAEALRRLSLEQRRRERMAAAAHERAERFAWPHVAAEVLDTYEHAVALADPARRSAAWHARTRARCAMASCPPICSRVYPLSACLRWRPSRRRWSGASGASARCAAPAWSRRRWPAARWQGSRFSASASRAWRHRCSASKPGLLVAGLALMCAAMFTRAIAWHAILAAAPTWRRAKRRDAMQGTFIGVLMSSTLPARLGEPSRALIVARRLGRARETLPVVLGTMVSQTLLNLLALAILGGVTLSSASALDSHYRALLLVGLAPLAALLASVLGPILLTPGVTSRARIACRRSWQACGAGWCACATACACSPARALRRARPSSSWPRGRFSGCPAGFC